jgi:rRNA maturation protein Nop10
MNCTFCNQPLEDDHIRVCPACGLTTLHMLGKSGECSACGRRGLVPVPLPKRKEPVEAPKEA